MVSVARKHSGLIVNVDDLGMCHGANAAFLDLWSMGRCDSGSVMVPCPWFSEIAEAGQDNPALKLGLHFTLTSEKAFYRWRPLTAPRASSGLVDDDGYFHQDPIELRRRADPAAVEAEMRAQIEAFLAKGLIPSHFDPHQDAAIAPEFVSIYVSLGKEFDTPVLFPSTISSHASIAGIGEVEPTLYSGIAEQLRREGHVVVDRILETPWEDQRPAADRYAELFSDAGKGGLTFVALHANTPGEIEWIEPATAAIRIDEYELLRSPAPLDWLDHLDVTRGNLSDFQRAIREESTT